MPDTTDRNLSQLVAESASASPLFRGLLGHHINNALCIVLADLEFAIQHTSDDEARAALEEALDAARRIGTIVLVVRGEAKAEAASPTLPEVEARLSDTWGPRASLHVARTGGSGVWTVWVTAGSGVLASAEAPSVAAAVEELLRPKAVRG